MNETYAKAQLLFRQERFELAVSELQKELAANPDNSWAHLLLARSLSRLEKHDAAIAAASRAIELAPDNDYSHWVMAGVLLDRGQLGEAREAAETALELDPNDSANFGLLARIEFITDNWQKVIELTDRGLALNAEDDVCRHFRSLALLKLGRTEEAEREMSTLMADDPEDPNTHEAQGWLYLERGESEKAENRFLESLRLAPGNESARTGLANALKARHAVFGWVLKLLLWTARFKTWTIWVAVIVFFVGLAQLRKLAVANPALFWPVWMLDVAALLLVVAATAGHPLFNLVLRASKRTRIALSPAELRASNWHLVCLLAALVFGLLAAWKGDRQMRSLGLASLLLTFAITNTFAASEGWVRMRMGWVTIVAAVCIPLSFVIFVVSLYLLLKHRIGSPGLIKLGLLYLPMISVLLSCFSDNLAETLERRKPDRD